MANINTNDLPPKKALMVGRIIWLALLLGPLMFLAVIVSGAVPVQKPIQPNPIFFWMVLGMLVTIVPGTFAFRTIVFMRARVDGFIPVAAYSTGNLIFWAGCEGVSFAGLVLGFVNGSLWPNIVIVAIAMGLQVISFPTGKGVKGLEDKSSV